MIKIKDYSPDAPSTLDKDDIQDQTKKMVDKIGKLQDILYAQKKHSLLVVYQGMDASGKDGATEKVFRECHPSGLNVISFKKPTEEEFAHDFLWRVHKHTPAKGMIHIFNRSHYEDVLIQRVHGWITEEQVDKRIQSINAFEKLLQYDANTTILKFYLHISYDQQKLELQERIDEKDKHWKHNSNDWKERERWDEYMFAYEDVFNRSEVPWHIVPVDQRWYRDYVISKAVLEALESLPLDYPPLAKE
jgi:PPK2 family polyphosphate:nucleotide phosphotransferase